MVKVYDLEEEEAKLANSTNLTKAWEAKQAARELNNLGYQGPGEPQNQAPREPHYRAPNVPGQSTVRPSWMTKEEWEKQRVVE